MIGVNRRVYRAGVHQGQDLFDQRTSLVQYAELFNAFPEVTFPVSVLSSGQNQELVSYAWIFPNVVTSGHWWYSNIPVYIENDLRARLQAVPKTKQIAYYSDMYKLEFGLPKFAMYRRILAKVLADDFVRPGVLNETGAVALARRVSRDTVERFSKVGGGPALPVLAGSVSDVVSLAVSLTLPARIRPPASGPVGRRRGGNRRRPSADGIRSGESRPRSGRSRRA